LIKVKPKLFFILGCQRIGTTLARFILESHSKIFCVDEHRAYSILPDKNLLKKAKNKDLVAGELYWKFKTSSYFNYVNNSVPIIKIHYEDLVTKKKITIKRILDFLNLKWEDSVLSNEKLTHTETDESGITVGNNDSKIPIHSSSVGKHKKFLKQQEKSELLKNNQRFVECVEL